MILSFKEQFVNPIWIGREVQVIDSPANTLPNFTSIPKIHTLRDDPAKRWKAGMPIQFWKGSPRNKGSYHFGNGKCVSVQELEFNWVSVKGFTRRTPLAYSETYNLHLGIKIDGIALSESGIYKLSTNDGFRSFERFAEWFPPFIEQPTYFKKRLIHWTDKRY